MSLAGEIISRIADLLSSIGMSAKPSVFDGNDNPIELEVGSDNRFFRVRIDEVVKIDRSKELIDFNKRLTTGEKMKPDDIKAFFDLVDEHHGTKKKE